MAPTTYTVRSLHEITELIAKHGSEEGIVVELGRTISKLSEAQAMARRLREKEDHKRWAVVNLKGLEPLEGISADLFNVCRSLNYIINITKASDHAATDASTTVPDNNELDHGQRARLVAEKLHLHKRRAVSAEPQFDVSSRSALHAVKPLGTGQAYEVSTNLPKRPSTDQGSRRDGLRSPQAAAACHGAHLADVIRSVSAERRRPNIDSHGTRFAGSLRDGLADVIRSPQAARHGAQLADVIRSVSAERGRPHIDSHGTSFADSIRSISQAAHSGARFPPSRDNDANRSLAARPASASAERHRLGRPKGRFINPELADSIHKSGVKLVKAPILSVANLGDRLKKLGLNLLRDKADVTDLRAELIACKKEVVAVWNSKVSLI